MGGLGFIQLYKHMRAWRRSQGGLWGYNALIIIIIIMKIIGTLLWIQGELIVNKWMNEVFSQWLS